MKMFLVTQRHNHVYTNIISTLIECLSQVIIFLLHWINIGLTLYHASWVNKGKQRTWFMNRLSLVPGLLE